MAKVASIIRNKARILPDICADCSSQDPEWACLNRGILLCDACCSVHRSLGRHVSQVKSLNQSRWYHEEKNMVYSLSSSGSNLIWEHTLMDPTNCKGLRKKPQPSDPLHPTKADFIRIKHLNLSFVHRSSANDVQSNDLSKQLYASVRTINLDASLKLLAVGANPNFINPDKRNCAIHVAAAAGQASQIELLVLYGADPGYEDKEGKCPSDYARENGHSEIAERLLDLQYEVTDRLSYYLCSLKADHVAGVHWIIPDIIFDENSIIKDAKSTLISLPNISFEELLLDIFDEVDRRETDVIFVDMRKRNPSDDQCSIPFLPLNPLFSATRNQGRQKLARYTKEDLRRLIHDVLVEARRRVTQSASEEQSPTEFKSSRMNSLSNDDTNSAFEVRKVNSKNASPQTNPLSAVNNPSYTANIPDSAIPQATKNLSENRIMTGSSLIKPPSHPVPSCQNFNKSSNSSVSTCKYLNEPSSSPVSANESLDVSTRVSVSTCQSLNNPYASALPCDDPVYDSVASDEDYSSWDRKRKLREQLEELCQQNQKNVENSATDPKSFTKKSDVSPVNIKSDLSPLFKESEKSDLYQGIPVSEYLEMKRHLQLSQFKIEELQHSNVAMSARLNQLTDMVQNLQAENKQLRRHDSLPHDPHNYFPPKSPFKSNFECSNISPYSQEADQFTSDSAQFTPNSTQFMSNSSQFTPNSTKFMPNSAKFTSLSPKFTPISTHLTRTRSAVLPYSHSRSLSPSLEPTMRSLQVNGIDNFESSTNILNDSLPRQQIFPSQEEVVRRTERITRRIQELLYAAQNSQFDRFLTCSESIQLSVQQMSEIFPKSIGSNLSIYGNYSPEFCSIVFQSVEQLEKSASRLHGECRNDITSQLHVLDPPIVTQKVIQCAYDIAKAAKSLVTHFQ